MAVGARATTSDEGVREDKRQGRPPGNVPFDRFEFSLLVSSCEFQESAGTCADRERTGSGCNNHDLSCDFHTVHAICLALR